MENIIFKIVFLIGVTFLSGYGLRFLLQKKEHFKYLLGFSGAILFSLVIHHLLPELYTETLEKGESLVGIGYYMIAGFLLQLFLDFFSKGLEHGHIHLPKKNKYFPWSIFISLCFHAYIEGFPLQSFFMEENVWNTYFWSVLIHKIPIAIALGGFFKTNRETYWALFIFACMAPLGAFSEHFLLHFLPSFEENIHFVNAFVTGMLLHIATVILLETDQEHHFNRKKITFVLIGFLLGALLF